LDWAGKFKPKVQKNMNDLIKQMHFRATQAFDVDARRFKALIPANPSTHRISLFGGQSNF
jgi:hypothetical protein